MRMMTQPKAMAAMGANRVAERRDKEKAELMEMLHAFAQRVVELSKLVAALQERVEKLEGDRDNG